MPKENGAYKFFTEILSDDERSAVEQFVANKKMVEVVRKILLDRIMFQGVKPEPGKDYKLRNFAFGLDDGTFNDEQYGRAIRTHLEALMIVEQQFKLITQLGAVPLAPLVGSALAGIFGTRLGGNWIS